VLALAPGDPFEELATNPAVPPEVRANLRTQFGLDDPVAVRYVRWSTAMAKGDWGFSFASRVNVDDLIMQRLPTTLAVIGSSIVIALIIALVVGIYAATRALFDLRSDREHVRADRLCAAHVLHRDRLHPDLQHLARLAAVRLSRRHPGDRVALVVGAAEADDHAGHGARALPGRLMDALRALGGARCDPPRLRDHRALEGTRRARRDPEARRAQRADSVVTVVALQMPTVFGGAIVTEQIFRVPGIGSLLISAILANDTPVIMAVTFVISILVILCNLLADLAYVWLDPRIAYR
jgi:peptide/nickel transport system permease protein